MDPDERITCEQALEHPYLKTFHDPTDEPEGHLFDDQYETQDYPIAEWKSKIFDLTSNKIIFNLCYFIYLARIFHEIQTFVPPSLVDI